MTGGWQVDEKAGRGRGGRGGELEACVRVGYRVWRGPREPMPSMLLQAWHALAGQAASISISMRRTRCSAETATDCVVSPSVMEYGVLCPLYG